MVVAENLSNLSSIQNFQSTKSVKQKTISSEIHLLNSQMKNSTVCNNIEEAQPFLKTCLVNLTQTLGSLASP